VVQLTWMYLLVTQPGHPCMIDAVNTDWSVCWCSRPWLCLGSNSHV